MGETPAGSREESREALKAVSKHSRALRSSGMSQERLRHAPPHFFGDAQRASAMSEQPGKQANTPSMHNLPSKQQQYSQLAQNRECSGACPGIWQWACTHCSTVCSTHAAGRHASFKNRPEQGRISGARGEQAWPAGTRACCACGVQVPASPGREARALKPEGQRAWGRRGGVQANSR